MTDNTKLLLIYLFSGIFTSIGVYFDLGVSFIAFPCLLCLICTLGFVYGKAQGTRLSKLAKTAVYIFVYTTLLLVITWLLSFSLREYLNYSWWEYFFTKTGLYKFFLFVIFMAFCCSVFLSINFVSKAILQLVLDLWGHTKPWLRRRLLYFVGLYIYIVVIFGVFYNVIYTVSNSSFTISGNGTPRLHDFLYFSTTLMVTLGTSDMAPVSAIVKCVGVAQIFLTVFVLLVYLSYIFSDSLGGSSASSN